MRAVPGCCGVEGHRKSITLSNAADAFCRLPNGSSLSSVLVASCRYIVFDLNMPVMNGWQFRAEQRHLSPKRAAVPVLLMSGEEDAPGHAVALKAIGVVPKPFAAEALLDAVRRVMGK